MVPGMVAELSEDVPMDVPIPDPWERGEEPRAATAARLGISVRTLQRRYALGRQVIEEKGEVQESKGGGSTDDLPWVELSTGPDRRWHYRLDHDQASVLPTGPFRITDHAGRRLRVVHSADGKPVERPRPSKHKFRPRAGKKRIG